MTPLRIDGHAHVFTRALPLAAERRYAPAEDAPCERLLALMDRYEIAGAVLVQPSFLGVDNGYLLSSLKLAPQRLRGIVVVEPATVDAALAAFNAMGVVGMRLNLIGRDARSALGPDWRALARRVAALGWQIELQAEGRDLPGLIDALAPVGAPLVIDHFGRPDAALGCGDPGFRRMLADGPAGAVFVKLSGAYRCGGADVRPYVRALLDALGPERLVWGSDWPFTQFAGARDYADGLAELDAWLGPAAQAAIAQTARRLFRFPDRP